MSTRDCIVFAGGGTGGHVFPGLAVIDELKKAGMEKIVWIGSKKGMEKKLIDQSSIPFYSIPSGKLRRYFSFQNFFDVFKILCGFLVSVFLLIKLRPRLLFSKGGYVSVPPVAAAALLGIPVLTHESDYDPGIATKINALFAKHILTSFEDTGKFFAEENAAKVIYTGNPVRPIFLTADAQKGRAFVGCPSGKKLLLVIGGSLGANALNQAILQHIDVLTADYFIVHQMGQRGYVASSRANYYAAPFFNAELADILAAADLVLCRAGSNTLWELAATQTPAVLVPLTSSASRGDQQRNAELFQNKGAAVILPEADLQAKLLEIISNLINNTSKLAAMRQGLKSLSRVQAAGDIAAVIMNEFGR